MIMRDERKFCLSHSQIIVPLSIGCLKPIRKDVSQQDHQIRLHASHETSEDRAEIAIGIFTSQPGLFPVNREHSQNICLFMNLLIKCAHDMRI